MKIFNEFGIKPTNTFVSAGSDYYIPNINDFDRETSAKALKAFSKSYKIDLSDIYKLYSHIEKTLEDPAESNQITNIIHLFLATGNKNLDELKYYSMIDAIDYFYDNYIIFDEHGNAGVKLKLNDTLFINSGIKVALDTVIEDKASGGDVNVLRDLGIGIAGLYVNKSGKGNAGFDVRACLVDEDYAGFVHLSMAYTKALFTTGQNIVYCGDKLVQMMLVPVFYTEYVEVSEEEYNNIMSSSERGADGFGSSDVQH